MPDVAERIAPPAAGMALVVGRLRLNQAEVRTLIRGRRNRDAVAPGPEDCARTALVADALTDAMTLVGDDALVARWLRASLPRRGGASPLQEASWVDGEPALRFVLRPHPTELVRLVAGLDGPADRMLVVAAHGPAASG